ADSGKIGHLVNTVFKLTGLDSMNRIARDTALNAELAKFEKEARNNPDALRKKIEPMFGKETQSVIE
ncbi:MAG: hypothetical protein GWN61_15035, partial [candidate division Zixibacteria bacterium]|nr:hypothetical protein [candidate division Zixibacteria bacterium]NIR65551.1 hypothetical protein [candidate division Zixibacteria bacterium]NIS47239.1 hypothetical protein [candidate division Zixibacteria bacterium]NIU15378.1 hypothetical protein [candidate division Zixibacteria bacterium]NIV07447.1 hypothetical protein [candidate division Zixibacteria bacterium]